MRHLLLFSLLLLGTSWAAAQSYPNQGSAGSAAAQQRSHRFARTLHGCSRVLSMMVDGRRVAKMLAEVRPHGLHDLG